MPSEKEIPAEEKQRIMGPLLGIILVLFGGLLLLGALIPGLNISIKKLWPLFFIIPIVSSGLPIIKFGKKASGAIIPVVILSFLMVYFIYLNYAGWEKVSYSWPNFILAPGLAFVALFLLERKIGLLFPAIILCGLATIFYLNINTPDNQLSTATVIGILLVTIGVLVIINNIVENKKQKSEQAELPDKEQ